MDFKEIKRLVKLVEASDIEELEIQEQGLQVRITKGKTYENPGSGIGTGQVVHAVPPPVQTAHPEAPIHEAKIEPVPGKESGNIMEICSPMVGTFYRASSPDATPYVEVGTEIHPGKILCIVEAMKLMNEIEAEISGKIVKILLENAQPVEYNQPLFLVEKT